MGGMTCAASPASATRLRAGHLRRQAGEGERRARADVAERAEQALQPRLEGGAEGVVVESGEPARDGRAVDPDQARGAAGGGDDGQRAAGTMEFRRDAVVGALVREGAGDRALVIAPGARRDAGRGAAQRVAPVGADDEAGCDARAVGEPDVGLPGADLDAGHRAYR